MAAGGGFVVLLTGGRGGSLTAAAAGQEPSLLGDAVVAVSGLVLGVKAVVTKRLTRRVSPGTLILWHDVLGASALLACGVAVGEGARFTLTPGAAASLLYQGLAVGGFCFGAQAVLLKTYSAARVTAFNAATPVFGVASAVLILGDPLSPWLLLAAAAVAGGIVLVNRRG